VQYIKVVDKEFEILFGFNEQKDFYEYLFLNALFPVDVRQ